jgi:hypothetical protein
MLVPRGARRPQAPGLTPKLSCPEKDASDKIRRFRPPRSSLDQQSIVDPEVRREIAEDGAVKLRLLETPGRYLDTCTGEQELRPIKDAVQRA